MHLFDYIFQKIYKLYQINPYFIKIYDVWPDFLLKYMVTSAVLNKQFGYLKIKVLNKKSHLEFRFNNGISFLSYYPDIPLYFLGPNSDYSYTRMYHLKEGDVVIDCGANVGGFALYAAKSVDDSGRVIAFEPDTKNYNKLLENIALNNLRNVIAIKKGVYSENTNRKFFNKGTTSSSLIEYKYTSIKDNTNAWNNSVIFIPLVALDGELPQLKVDRVDFIKMDIEGSELEALKGCIRILKNNKLNLAIASYHIVNGLPTCNDVEKLLLEVDYYVYTHDKLVTYAWKSQ
ncbi:MAG: FkbM family methyltransferase [Methanotrichaceae archaeon]|nr:FkbM family methyltransferase [Methanotrichaceae archaeon]